jgi:Asp/Glu/hydantoin racemase
MKKEKKRLGLIRVLTTTDKTLLNVHGKLIEGWYPGLSIYSACIPGQPEGIHDDRTEKIALPKVLALAEKMAADGMEAIIVSCAGDPAVLLAGKKLSIPVIGAGRAVAFAARTLEKPVGVLGITTEVPKPVAKALGKYLAGNMVPDGVVSTLDLMKPKGMKAVIEAGKKLKAGGAELIVLACTGLSTIGAAEQLRESLGIPVIDPVRAEAAMAWLAVM